MDAEQRFVSFLLRWHGIGRQRAGYDGLQRTIRQLQGADLPLSDLEYSILRVRLRDYSPLQLDESISRGEIVWQGSRSLGEHDGEISLYLKQEFPLLGEITLLAQGSRESRLRDILTDSGALEFERILDRVGGFPEEILRTLWKLAWNGEVTSDSLNALRARLSSSSARRRGRTRSVRYSTRKRNPPGAAGRWTLLSGPRLGFAPESERQVASARQLLDRLGFLSQVSIGNDPAALDELKPALDTLESRGLAQRIRLMETDSPLVYAAPGAEETWRTTANESMSCVLSACDPANPFGALLSWPGMVGGYRPLRSPGARVFIENGRLIGYLTRTGRGIYMPESLTCVDPLMDLLKRMAQENPVYLELVNGDPPYKTPWHGDLVASGFSPSRRGYLLRAQP